MMTVNISSQARAPNMQELIKVEEQVKAKYWVAWRFYKFYKFAPKRLEKGKSKV